MKPAHILILILAGCLIPIHQAHAHKVILFAWVEDGMIHTESSFSSKRKARDSILAVMDEKGHLVHEGMTDENGRYSFKVPDQIDSDLILLVKAGQGHQGEWRIPRSELILPPAQADPAAVSQSRESVEKTPSVFKIFSGIALIFALALAVRCLKTKKPEAR